jgi:hypothetical protein
MLFYDLYLRTRCDEKHPVLLGVLEKYALNAQTGAGQLYQKCLLHPMFKFDNPVDEVNLKQ